MKELKKVAACFMATLCMLTVTGFAAATNREVTVAPNRPPFSITAGEGYHSFTVVMDVNRDRLLDSENGIENVVLTIDQPYSAGVIDQVVNPVRLEFAKYTVPVNSNEVTESGSFSFTIKAMADEGASTGSFSIPLKVSYFDKKESKLVEYDEKLLFSVTRPSQNTRVNIRKVEISKDDESTPLKAGESFVAVVYIQNKGDFYIEDAKVSLRNLSPDTFTVTNLGDMKYIDIPDGESISTLFQLVSSPDLPDGKYVLTVRLDYRDHNDILRYEEAQTFVTIGDGDNTPSSEYSTPVMLIDSYSFGGDHITGGETFDLNMVFRNTNRHSKVDNVRVSIMDQSGTILPKRSSNTFYIDQILPGEKANFSMQMYTDTTATPKPYQLSVRYQYEGVVNGRRIAYTESELISIPLVQPEVLSVDTVVVPKNSVVGSASPIGATFINKGKSPISNLTVSIAGDFEGAGQPYYVGSLPPGKTDSYDATIVPATEGELLGELVFTYDDFEGVKKEYRQPFVFSVSAQSVSTSATAKPTFVPPTEVEEESVPTTYYMMAGLAALAVVWYFIKARKKTSIPTIEEKHHEQ